MMWPFCNSKRCRISVWKHRSYQVQFNQLAMRSHLTRCFEQGFLSPFPRSTEPVKMKPGRAFDIDVQMFMRNYR